MSLAGIFFYIFSVLVVLSGATVVVARNPVHGILFLVLAFFNAACLFLLMGAEFLALVLIIVYVGAVAVLFLFVVMVLDVDFVELRQGFLSYLPAGLFIIVVLSVELILAFSAWRVSPHVSSFVQIPVRHDVSNVQAFGEVLYTQYVHHFQVAGLILLVAMIGAIVLTLRHRRGVRRQLITDQVARCPETSVEIRKVRSGQGI